MSILPTNHSSGHCPLVFCVHPTQPLPAMRCLPLPHTRHSKARFSAKLRTTSLIEVVLSTICTSPTRSFQRKHSLVFITFLGHIDRLRNIVGSALSKTEAGFAKRSIRAAMDGGESRWRPGWTLRDGVERSKPASWFYLASGQCSSTGLYGQESDTKHIKVFATKRQFVEMQNR